MENDLRYELYTSNSRQLRTRLLKCGMALQSIHECRLTDERIDRPVVVMNYPKDIKNSYMRMNDDSNTVTAMDVLAPDIGEIIGGSRREEWLQEMNLDKADYWGCSDLRKYGTVPHAGFEHTSSTPPAWAT